jgi:hypothetical protein
MKYYFNLKNDKKGGQELIEKFNKFVDGRVEDKRKQFCIIEEANLNLDLKNVFVSSFKLHQG